jgi:hypothetical protein
LAAASIGATLAAAQSNAAEIEVLGHEAPRPLPGRLVPQQLLDLCTHQVRVRPQRGELVGVAQQR